MNKKLLLKVKQAILKEPRKLHMDYGLAQSDNRPCGTVGCIAGWAVAISEAKKTHKAYKKIAQSYQGKWANVEPKARKLLKLDERQSFDLFHKDQWPSYLYVEYSGYLSDHNFAKAAEVAAKRIDMMIKQGL